MRHLLIGWILTSVLDVAAQAQPVPRYVVTDLGTLGGPFTSSVATGINNRGDVVGYSYYDVLPPGGISVVNFRITDAFFYDGTMHDLGAEAGVAFDINDSGDILTGGLGH